MKSHHQKAIELRVGKSAQKIINLIEPFSKVLDIGAGNGYLKTSLQDFDKTIIYKGVDIQKREKMDNDIVVFDGETLPFEDNSFDYCIFLDVIHHLDYPNDLLNEAKRVAKKGIIIKDRSFNNLFSFLMLNVVDRLSNMQDKVKCPCNFRNIEQWADLFNTLNFSIEYMDINYKIKNIDFAENVIFKIVERKGYIDKTANL